MVKIHSIDTVKGVGPTLKNKFFQNQIYSTYDLLLIKPSNVESFNVESLSYLNHNQNIVLEGKIVGEIKLNFYTKVKGVSFNIIVDNELIEVIGFNQLYIKKTYHENQDVFVKGKFNYYRKQLVLNKIFSVDTFSDFKVSYKLTDIHSKTISNIINEIFISDLVSIVEVLPQVLINKFKLLQRKDAFYKLHLPKNLAEFNKAIEYFKFEEAFLFFKELEKNINKDVYREPKKYDLKLVKDFIETINFELTQDQKDAVNDIFKDYKDNKVSYRLIQGDVGSGKTIVAIIAILGAISAGEQVVLMAPTEILAKQHYNNIKKYFSNLNIEICLLTSDSKNKNILKENIKSNKCNLIIGTHALVQDDVIYNKLGLIIIDEQHKFGVNTRNQLVKKGSDADLIYLTATPIPRTLAITLFNEAKISVIKEKPENRKAVVTSYVNDSNLRPVYDQINQTLSLKQKVYVVVPAVTSLHANYNIENVYKMLVENSKTKNIYTLHGKTKKSEQDEVINRFINDSEAILIATTMIEVGIDVKDATLMVIFAADYFGLSQLHQLRGRVGRSNLASKCLLVSNKENQERLLIMESIDDGFVLSEQDLKLRGPGDLLGLDQSGIINFKFIDFATDYNILVKIKDEIKQLK